MGNNPLILIVGGLQIAGGIYSLLTGDWRMAVINVCVGVANGVLSTVKA
jgi:hypothetical protein